MTTLFQRHVAAPIALVLVVATLAGCDDTAVPEKSTAAAPDILFVNGTVHTMDENNPTAEAVAISGKLITAVGDSEELLATADDGTEVVDLAGQVIFPGFFDTHVHPVFGGMSDLNCKIPQGSSAESIQNIVSACAENAKDGEWIYGGQWDAASIGKVPDRGLLDAVVSDRPVLLHDTSGHSALANGQALAIAGITRDTPNPEGGIIERDSNGEPTGVLRESAIGLVRLHQPPADEAKIRRALITGLEKMLAAGITSFTEASAGFVAGGELETALYAGLADEGILKQRARICLVWGDVDYSGFEGLYARRGEYASELVKTDCIKIHLDGVPTDSHTAAMLEPYENTMEGRDDEASRYGLILVEQDKLNAAVTRFDKDGMTVKFHAAGDAAVRASLDAIEAARNANGQSGLHHNPGHVTFIAPEDIPRAKELDATLELSPYLWTPSPINDDITRAIGAERIKRVWAFREMLDAGAPVAIGSDWAVVPSVDPWIAVEALVTRGMTGGGDKYFGPEQRITLHEAMQLLTVAGARHMNREHDLGMIKEGYLADLIVVDRDPYQLPETELHKVSVKRTVIDGETVYQAPQLSVEMFKGDFATVNSFIFSNGKSLTIVDVQRKTYEAEKLVEVIKAKNLPVTQILITHGHTDHFTGMPLMRKEFPDARIVVANEAIRKEIKAYAIYMDGFGATAAEPPLEAPLKPKSAENPDGFDYESYIQILPNESKLEMDGGGILELTTDYLPSEAETMTTLYSPELNALFLSDLGYNKVHHWQGDDITYQHIANWRTELLRIKAEYADRNPTVYPGHGDVTDMSVFDGMVQYIDDYVRITQSATSREQAQAEMEALYPEWGEADFFLKYSIENHVK